MLKIIAINISELRLQFLNIRARKIGLKKKLLTGYQHTSISPKNGQKKRKNNPRKKSFSPKNPPRERLISA